MFDCKHNDGCCTFLYYCVLCGCHVTALISLHVSSLLLLSDMFRVTDFKFRLYYVYAGELSSYSGVECPQYSNRFSSAPYSNQLCVFLASEVARYPITSKAPASDASTRLYDKEFWVENGDLNRQGYCQI